MESTLRPRLINIGQLAIILGLKPQTIRNQLSCGIFPIPSKKINGALRWDIDEVDRFLKRLGSHEQINLKKGGENEVKAALRVPH